MMLFALPPPPPSGVSCRSSIPRERLSNLYVCMNGVYVCGYVRVRTYNTTNMCEVSKRTLVLHVSRGLPVTMYVRSTPYIVLCSV